MKLLPPLFTWQDFLDWAEQVAPDAPLADVQRLFDLCATHGAIRPYEINENDEFVYELRPMMAAVRAIEVVFLKERT